MNLIASSSILATQIRKIPNPPVTKSVEEWIFQHIKKAQEDIEFSFKEE
jgi:hypothetical protein